MASLSTQGIGSGLDISGIVSKIMTLEKVPLVNLGTAKVELNTQLSAYGKLKSTVSKLQTTLSDLVVPANFRPSKANSSAPTVLTASADATAAKGSYAVEVKRIAETHRMVAGTILVDADSTKVGATDDTMAISVGSKTFTVNIGNKTLNDIRDAINNSTSNAGVTASILHDDAGYRLTLAANDTGSKSFIAVKYHTVADPVTDAPDLLSLASTNTDRDGSGGFTSADLDAELRLESTYTVTSSSNTVSGVIGGVTMNLVAAGTSTVSVSRDDAKITGNVQSLVSGFNDVLNTMEDMRAQTLKDDSASLLGFESQLRATINKPVTGSSKFSTLAEIGIQAQRDGTLSVNTAVLGKALAKDPEGVVAMFTNATNGAAVRLKKLTDNVLGVSGMFPGREESLKKRITANQKETDTLTYRLSQREASLNRQFNALDSLVASLNSTSSYLTTQLAQFTANNKLSNS